MSKQNHVSALTFIKRRPFSVWVFTSPAYKYILGEIVLNFAVSNEQLKTVHSVGLLY